MSSQDRFLAEGIVGAQSRGDGSYSVQRMAKTGALVIAQAHGRYFEAASRGKLFTACVATSVAPGTALSTSPAFQIYNPTGSGILVAIKKIYVGFVSGTLGAGYFVHSRNLAQPSAPTGGTAIVPAAALLNGARGIALPNTGSTIAATSIAIRPSISAGALVDSTAAAGFFMEDNVEGSIVIPAGVVYCFQGIMAAGSSPLVNIGALYEEIPVP